MSSFKEGTEKWQTSFLKETVENAYPHKAVLKKTMTTKEKCVKYDFVAPLMWNFQHINFISRWGYWQIFKSALVYL